MAINPIIKQKAEDIRKKIFGTEVRESLASGLEGMSEDVESIKGRQGNVENQFQVVLDETTGKDVISAPELIAARNGEANLKTRLDDEHAQVTAQLAETETQIKKENITPLYINSFDGSNQVYHPSVLHFPSRWCGFEYWMAYTPYPIGALPYTDRWESPCIAVSNNGTSWTTPVGLTNPLQDLTQLQIDRKDFFSDPSIVMNGTTMEMWYRHTDGSNPSNTNIHRITTTDGIAWTEPETVLDSQKADNGIGGINSTFRSHQILYDGVKYTSYYCYSGGRGMRVAESTNPSSGVWSNMQDIVFSPLQDHNPWHSSVYYDGSEYHLIAYYSVRKTVEYFKSTDGINFAHQKVLISADEKKYSNLVDLYQAVCLKVGNEWKLYSSCQTKRSGNANYTILENGIFLMVGDSLMNLVSSEIPKVTKDKQVFESDIILSTENKPNSVNKKLIFSMNEDGTKIYGIGTKFVNGKLIPTYYHKDGNGAIPTLMTGVGTPTHFNYIGEFYQNLANPSEFYVCVSTLPSWVRITNDEWHKHNYLVVSGRSNVALNSSISASGAYRIVINTISTLEPIVLITGGVDGQEIVILNVTGGDVTLTHTASGNANSMKLRGSENLILKNNDAVKLHNISGTWYQI